MKWLSAVACVILAGCATVPRGALTSSPLTQFAHPGPYRVVQYDVDWFDAKRQRHVPVHIYAPESNQTMPVVIFSHGLGNSRRGYSYLGRHWASYGYLSIHPSHVGANTAVARRGWFHLFRAGFDRGNWKNLPEDIHFIIDQLEKDDALPAALRGRVDRAHIAVSGHSLGAYTALAVGGMRVLFPDQSVVNFRDPRVSAAIPISMSENFQPASYTEVAIPMLHVTGTRDWDPLYGTWSRKRRVPFNSIHRNDQYLLVVGGANHSTFSDEENDATRPAHEVMRMTSIVFLNAYLRGDREALAALRDGELARALDGLGRLTIKSPPALRIGKISVHTAPVFSSEEASQGGLYRAVDLVAIKTPDALIRRFLLFREGDEFSQSKLTESERNLRAFDFLKTVSITTGQPHDGVVDVDVTTQDAFSTNVDVEFSNDGGRSLYTFAVTQLDLFGRGDALGVHTEQGRERRLNSIEFVDPATFGRYWNGDALLAKNSDGNEERLAIGRPLFSSSTHFTTSALTDHLLQTARVYQNAAIASQFRQEHRQLSFLVGPALQTGAAGNTRVLAGFDFLTDSFAPLFGIAPDDRRFRFAQLGVDSTQFTLIKEDHVDFGLKEQDFNLGMHASADISRSTQKVWRFRTDNSFGYRLGAHSFVVTHLLGTTRAGSTNRNTIWSDDTRLVLKFPTAYPMTFVTRLRLDYGSHLDRDVQFFADGQNGLRAYPNFAFEGNRRVLLNAEQRFFLGRELWQVVEPGAAIFADVARLRGTRSDIGGGLRFFIPRYESTVIRVDAAYALNDSPISKRGLVIAVATTQAF
jgi:predicted dienelactone hydrolase